MRSRSAGPRDLGPIKHLALVFEPARLLAAKGLVLGVRSFGEAGDTPIEPMIGLRRAITDRFAIAGVGYGTYARGANTGASYSALRLGGELVDQRGSRSICSARPERDGTARAWRW